MRRCQIGRKPTAHLGPSVNVVGEFEGAIETYGNIRQAGGGTNTAHYVIGASWEDQGVAWNQFRKGLVDEPSVLPSGIQGIVVRDSSDINVEVDNP